jgi:succinate-semialdehyde dehydrogenase/glutarate-semialdehyde dehydrogenase
VSNRVLPGLLVFYGMLVIDDGDSFMTRVILLFWHDHAIWHPLSSTQYHCISNIIFKFLFSSSKCAKPIKTFMLLRSTASTETTPVVGTEFCTNPLVKKISFTGSTRVGKILMAQSSDTVKRVSMELGGNACFVVFADADLDEAVNSAMASKFRNAGQTCVASDRFLVHASIHDEFVSKFAEKMKSIRVGPGIDSETQMGPLISVGSVQSVAGKVQIALKEGATIYEQVSLSEEASGPHFYPPTILTNVSVDSDIWKTETFGPVAAIKSFETEEEALQIANDVRVGLASYFCTNDLKRAFSFASSLEVGMVGVNEGIISSAAAPFGGVKESGIGTEGSPWGIKEYLETKYIFMKTSM